MNPYLKNLKIRFVNQRELEPHEVLLDTLVHKKETELGISEKRFEIPLSKKSIMVFLFGFLILGIFLFFRTFQLEILDREKYILLAKENRFRNYYIRAERGVIYDRYMNQLVFNKPSFDLVLEKRDLPQKEEDREVILKIVSKILNKPLEDLKKQIEETKDNKVLISENVSHEILILLEAKLKELSGFTIEKNTIRDYKDGQVFAHLLGYTGKIGPEELKTFKDYSVSDYIGKTGLEKFYEEILRGKPGIFQVEKDAYGNQKSEQLVQNPEPGKNLVLYLDSELQRKSTEALERTLKALGAEKGVAVAMDPNTGGILSLVSLPSYDNNIFSADSFDKEIQKIFQDPSAPMLNRVISGEYLTGSTIKPLMASAILQEKLISPQTQIYDKGFIEVQNDYDPKITYTYHDWKPHGWVDIRKAIAVSCNVYFYILGGGYENQEGLGVDRIKKYLGLFGWGQKTGIDLPQESEGFLPDPIWKKEVLKEPWTIGNTYHFSIGQGYLRITPIQVVASFAAIANGGKLLEPHVVKEIISGSPNSQSLVEEIKPKIIRENFIDPANLKIVREGMRGGVIYGSSVMLNDLPVTAAAKTGTAQTSQPDRYNNWVTVFAPYEHPEIVLTVMIEDVKNLQVAALPVAKEILKWYFSK
jgi:penicillin-binding protein 2